MTIYSRFFSTRKSSQKEKAHSKQTKNSAGGYSFELDLWARLDRWLILGAEGGTYYASEKRLTQENAQIVQKCLASSGSRTVAQIVEISASGRAPKNAPAIFALAMAAGHPDLATRKAALAAIPKVCRIGTDLFAFVDSVRNFRGWGRGLRRAIAHWYAEKAPDKLAYQVVKYQQRNGWSHRDVLRLAGGALQKQTSKQAAIFRWIVTGMDGLGERSVSRNQGKDTITYEAIDPSKLPLTIEGFERAKKAASEQEMVKLISDYRLTHEMIPNEFKNSPQVWEALLADMPLTAMLRNLGKMSNVGLLKPFAKATKQVVQALQDEKRIHKARIHPLAVLVALNTYAMGKGVKGSLKWEVVAPIKDALDEMFYAAFKTLEPTQKNILLGLDVSGSMSCGTIAGMTGISPRVGAAAMAMVTMRSETNYHTMAFSDQFISLPLSNRDRLEDVIRKTSNIAFGGTDCALPMIWALKNKVEVDAFYVYTDNETWAGNIHPFQALQEYRQKMDRDAKLIVVGMVSNGFSIANPDDGGMLDVVGFDTSAPKVMTDFVKQGFSE